MTIAAEILSTRNLIFEILKDNCLTSTMFDFSNVITHPDIVLVTLYFTFTLFMIVSGILLELLIVNFITSVSGIILMLRCYYPTITLDCCQYLVNMLGL